MITPALPGRRRNTQQSFPSGDDHTANYQHDYGGRASGAWFRLDLLRSRSAGRRLRRTSKVAVVFMRQTRPFVAASVKCPIPLFVFRVVLDQEPSTARMQSSGTADDLLRPQKAAALSRHISLSIPQMIIVRNRGAEWLICAAHTGSQLFARISKYRRSAAMEGSARNCCAHFTWPA
jgi:hypothetical protein